MVPLKVSVAETWLKLLEFSLASLVKFASDVDWGVVTGFRRGVGGARRRCWLGDRGIPKTRWKRAIKLCGKYGSKVYDHGGDDDDDDVDVVPNLCYQKPVFSCTVQYIYNHQREHVHGWNDSLMHRCGGLEQNPCGSRVAKAWSERWVTWIARQWDEKRYGQTTQFAKGTLKTQ